MADWVSWKPTREPLLHLTLRLRSVFESLAKLAKQLFEIVCSQASEKGCFMNQAAERW